VEKRRRGEEEKWRSEKWKILEMGGKWNRLKEKVYEIVKDLDFGNYFGNSLEGLNCRWIYFSCD
jgi:hypothetical protein